MATEVRITLTVDASGAISGINSAATSMTKLDSAAKKNADSLRKTGEAIKTFGGNLTGLGSSLTALTAPLAIAGGAAIKLAVDFDRSLTQIRTLVGASKSDIEGYRNAILELGGKTAKTPQELADALFAITSAGKQGKVALEILESAAKASAIGLGDVRAIALSVTAAITAYGEENLSAAKATDILVMTVEKGNLEASELAGTLGRVIPIASQLGISFDQVGAFIATFTRLGGDAAEATTALRGIMGALAKPTTAAVEAFKEMNTTVEKVQDSIRKDGLAATLLDLIDATDGNVTALSKIIPNIRALTGVLATAGAQGADFVKIADDIANSNGKTAESFKILQESTAFTFDQVKAQFAQTFTKLGDEIAPVLADMLKAAQPLFAIVEKTIEIFGALPGPVKTAALALAGITIALGPMLIAAGLATTGIGNLVQGFAFLTAKGGLGGLAAKLSGVIPGFSKLSGLFGTTAGSAAKLTPSLGAIGTSLKGLGPAAISGAKGLGSLAKNSLLSVNAVSGLKAGLFGVTAGTAALSIAAAGAGAVIGVKLGRALLETGDAIRGLDDPVRKAVNNVGLLEGASSLLGGAFDGLKNLVTNVTGAFESLGIVGDLLLLPFSGLQKLFEGLGFVMSGLSDGIESMAAVFQNVTDAQNPMADSTTAAKKAFDDFVVSQQKAQAALGVTAATQKLAADAAAILQNDLDALNEKLKETGEVSSLSKLEAQGLLAEFQRLGAAGLEVSAQVGQLKDRLNELAQEAIKTAAGALSTFASVRSEFSLLSAAVAQVGGVAQLTGDQTKKLRDDLVGMQAAGVDVSAMLSQVDEKLKALGLDEVSVKARELAESFGFLNAAEVAQEIEIFARAMELIPPAANLSRVEGEALFDQLSALKTKVGELPPGLAMLEAQLRDLGFDEAGREVAAFVAELEKGGLAGATARVEVLKQGIEQVGGVAGLTGAQIKALAAETETLATAGADVSGVLSEIRTEAAALAQTEALTAMRKEFAELSGGLLPETEAEIANLEIVIREAFGNGAEVTDEFKKAAAAALDELAQRGPGAAAAVKGIQDEFSLATSKAVDFSRVLADLSNIMQAFGISADSALGIAVSGITQFGAQLPALKADLKAGKLVGGAIGEGDVAGAASGVASGIAGIAAATSKGGAGKAALGGALAGASAGAQVGGPIGAGVGAAVGAIVGFFRGRGRDQIRKSIKEAVGADVSEDLAVAISDAAKEAGRTVQQQSLLQLSDIFGEVGVREFEGGLTGAANAVTSLMQGIADGSLPAREGIQEVGKAFGIMASETFEAGKIADASLVQIITNARALGQDIPEIAAFVAQQLGEAAAGIAGIIGQEITVDGEKMFGGLAAQTAQAANDQATIFAAGFFATVSEVGLVEAVDTFGPAFDEMKKKFAQFGDDVDFGGIGRLFEIASDERFRGILEGVDGLNDAMVGLANSGFLTADVFDAFQRQGTSAFDALVAGGLTTNEALQQMAPFLQSAIDASQNFGVELDDNTRSLIAQAEASGIAFEIDPMVQMADTLVVIAELLGATAEQLAGIGSTGADAGAAVAASFDGAGSALDRLDAAQQRTFSGDQFNESLSGIDALRDKFQQVADGEPMLRKRMEANVASLNELEAAIVNLDQVTLQEFVDSGGDLAEFARPALDSILQVQMAFDETANSAVDAFSGVGDEIGKLPGVADEAVAGIASSFADGTEAITSGLDPVAEKMATEIRDAGESTSQAISQSFDKTNEAIKVGLGEVASTFGGSVVQGALAAANAADKITAAALAAAKAAASISFPDFPDGGEGVDKSFASGFRGIINKTTRFTAHAGELVNILPAGVTNSLRARRSQPSTVSAQSGFGGISIEMGGLQVAINAPVERGEDGQDRIGITKQQLVVAMREIIDNDLGGMVTDSIREQLFEQT